METLKRVKDGLYHDNGNFNDKLFCYGLSAFSTIKEHNLTVLAKKVYALLDLVVCWRRQLLNFEVLMF